jgi:membrane protein YqaA with SNARE-associated domain
MTHRSLALSLWLATCRRDSTPIFSIDSSSATWSFFPFAPTDLVCYVCGTLKIDVKKCLFGVTLGEGAICAVYVAAGGQALRWLR